MSKKTLPKTPESLLDPIQYERSSRSITPSPHRSRSTTPKISPLRYTGKNRNIPWYEKFLISNITFYIFLILTFLLTLTVSRNFIPVNYCDEDNLDVDCIKCPENAKCSGTKYECIEGSYPFKDMCIKPNSLNEQAKNLIPIIEDLIGNRTVSTLSEIYEKLKSEGITKEQIRVAIHLSDKYVLNGESIDARWNKQSINLLLYSTLSLCLIIFLLSLFFRNRN